ncbi:MAG: hypothetical protein FWF60_08585 [Oscillospiraceae bacterium]|nr:hypothetical protein [Oscillospiraceae bacterium]MCL1952868.1 hypothetical protein [Oscillospiraceae bacterium]
MALFHRSARRARRFPGRRPWWEAASELMPPEAYEGDFDPLGSYTGVPDGGGEPVQDADDL